MVLNLSLNLNNEPTLMNKLKKVNSKKTPAHANACYTQFWLFDSNDAQIRQAIACPF